MARKRVTPPGPKTAEYRHREETPARGGQTRLGGGTRGESEELRPLVRSGLRHPAAGAAVKVIDDRGNDLMVVKSLKETV